MHVHVAEQSMCYYPFSYLKSASKFPLDSIFNVNGSGKNLHSIQPFYSSDVEHSVSYTLVLQKTAPLSYPLMGAPKQIGVDLFVGIEASLFSSALF